MAVEIEEYGLRFGTQNNLPIIQLVIDFLLEEIHLVGESIPISEWYRVADKKELLEATWSSHKFGFISFGEGAMESLVENGEFLKYILGKIATVIPIYYFSKIVSFEMEQRLAFQYIDEGKLQKDEFIYKRPLNTKESPSQYLHAYDLVGLKSLIFAFLLLMQEKGLTFTLLKQPAYQKLLQEELNKFRNDQENDSSDATDSI